VLWIGNGAADQVFSYDPQSRRWTTYQLPSRGALIRHLAIDGKTGDVWLAYGESPGKLPARIARLRR
jgi:streptogramin lyase